MPVTYRRPSPVASCAIISGWSWEDAPGIFAERCSVQRLYNLKGSLCKGPEEFFDCSLSQPQDDPEAVASRAGKKGSRLASLVDWHRLATRK